MHGPLNKTQRQSVQYITANPSTRFIGRLPRNRSVAAWSCEEWQRCGFVNVQQKQFDFGLVWVAQYGPEGRISWYLGRARQLDWTGNRNETSGRVRFLQRTVRDQHVCQNHRPTHFNFLIQDQLQRRTNLCLDEGHCQNPKPSSPLWFWTLGPGTLPDWAIPTARTKVFPQSLSLVQAVTLIWEQHGWGLRELVTCIVFAVRQWGHNCPQCHWKPRFDPTNRHTHTHTTLLCQVFNNNNNKWCYLMNSEIILIVFDSRVERFPVIHMLSVYTCGSRWCRRVAADLCGWSGICTSAHSHMHMQPLKVGALKVRRTICEPPAVSALSTRCICSGIASPVWSNFYPPASGEKTFST